jgi:HEAT repeat protein
MRAAVLLLPAGLLFLGIARVKPGTQPPLPLIIGAAFQLFLIVAFTFRSRTGWRQPIGPSVLLLYLVALGWVWLGRSLGDAQDWYLHFAQAVLLIGVMVIFGLQVFVDSRAPEWRRAQGLAQRLADRRDWPGETAACRALPEVKALREALAIDASPALALLKNPRPQVRLAALAALEFRKYWGPGQAEMVLHVARQSPEPAVRAAAVSALANVDDPHLVEQLGEFLRDGEAEVRRAATEALLWDTESRWAGIRLAVRRTLADGSHLGDGPLLPAGQGLTSEAVRDLAAWAGEKGFLAIRAAQTLGVHYDRVLAEQFDETLIKDLKQQLADPRAPAPLRMELARVLQEHHLLDPALQERLLDAMNPAPLRLLAADALLGSGDHGRAVATLHDIARLPNREIALATADVVQRRLGIDLGLPFGRSAPPVHSRLAAEVTRRVMAWAEQSDQPAAVSTTDSQER